MRATPPRCRLGRRPRHPHIGGMTDVLAHTARILVILWLIGPLAVLALGWAQIKGDWRTASHRPVGLAPDPGSVDEAVVQVYAARAFAWRGIFSVHTWIAVKPAGARSYIRYEVIGWNVFRGGKAIVTGDHRPADAEWFGARPVVLRELRGAEAEAVIAKLPDAVASYPWPDVYRAWPGPNSNTFTAHVARQVPELRLALPGHALGKDYLGDDLVAPAPSGTGWQLSWKGVVGVTLARDEGFELNLLGLTLGVDPFGGKLKLPALGPLPALE